MAPRLRNFAALWSLGQYPSPHDGWTMEEKLEAVEEAGFEGVMWKPTPELNDRGKLAFWAIGSLGVGDDPVSFLQEAVDCGAVCATIQPCDVETPLEDCLRVVRDIQKAARELNLPTAIESHRDTFTETPERTWALHDAYEKAEGEPLPICFDHSHFAVVRHLRPPYWRDLKGREDILLRCRQFHLRPFNGHHCQIPVTLDGDQRTPEYLRWTEFVRELFSFFKKNAEGDIFVVPELGSIPSGYGLSGFPDIWKDACIAGGDLRRIWEEQG